MAIALTRHLDDPRLIRAGPGRRADPPRPRRTRTLPGGAWPRPGRDRVAARRSARPVRVPLAGARPHPLRLLLDRAPGASVKADVSVRKTPKSGSRGPGQAPDAAVGRGRDGRDRTGPVRARLAGRLIAARRSGFCTTCTRRVPPIWSWGTICTCPHAGHARDPARFRKKRRSRGRAARPGSLDCHGSCQNVSHPGPCSVREKSERHAS